MVTQHDNFSNIQRVVTKMMTFQFNKKDRVSFDIEENNKTIAFVRTPVQEEAPWGYVSQFVILIFELITAAKIISKRHYALIRTKNDKLLQPFLFFIYWDFYKLLWISVDLSIDGYNVITSRYFHID